LFAGNGCVNKFEVLYKRILTKDELGILVAGRRVVLQASGMCYIRINRMMRRRKRRRRRWKNLEITISNSQELGSQKSSQRFVDRIGIY
jgi:hypothetical protein